MNPSMDSDIRYRVLANSTPGVYGAEIHHWNWWYAGWLDAMIGEASQIAHFSYGERNNEYEYMSGYDSLNVVEQLTGRES
jgi:hypothetical protein